MYEKCEYMYVRSIEVFTHLSGKGENPILDFVNIYTKQNEKQISVCSPTVRIIAFQAIDPGSTPGRRS